jgi:hypothetical protein
MRPALVSNSLAAEGQAPNQRIYLLCGDRIAMARLGTGLRRRTRSGSPSAPHLTRQPQHVSQRTLHRTCRTLATRPPRELSGSRSCSRCWISTVTAKRCVPVTLPPPLARSNLCWLMASDALALCSVSIIARVKATQNTTAHVTVMCAGSGTRNAAQRRLSVTRSRKHAGHITRLLTWMGMALCLPARVCPFVLTVATHGGMQFVDDVRRWRIKI